jgi:hypothetical protein
MERSSRAFARASARNGAVSYHVIRLCLWGARQDADRDGHRFGSLAPGPGQTSKMAATFYRSRKVFGPHGINRYSLYPDTDQVSVRRKQQCSCWSMLSTYISSLICFTLHHSHTSSRPSILHHLAHRGIMY